MIMIQCCDQEKQCKRETKTECTTWLCAVIAGERHPFEIWPNYREKNVYLKLEIRYDNNSVEVLRILVRCSQVSNMPFFIGVDNSNDTPFFN